MTYEELVATLKEIVEKADASKIKEHVAFQFNVEGKASILKEITGKKKGILKRK